METKRNRYRAIICAELGTPDVLRITRLPQPTLDPSDVRVHIVAAGVNFPDVLMVAGEYQFKPVLPFVPGMESGGMVVETGASVKHFRPGDRVIVRQRTGAFAEQAVVPESMLNKLPETLSFEEGASFLIAFQARLESAIAVLRQQLIVLQRTSRNGIATVRLYSIARLPWDQRWCDEHAGISEGAGEGHSRLDLPRNKSAPARAWLRYTGSGGACVCWQEGKPNEQSRAMVPCRFAAFPCIVRMPHIQFSRFENVLLTQEKLQAGKLQKLFFVHDNL
jgi:Alcohol dehydrogenase GroES-like domain